MPQPLPNGAGGRVVHAMTPKRPGVSVRPVCGVRPRLVVATEQPVTCARCLRAVKADESKPAPAAVCSACGHLADHHNSKTGRCMHPAAPPAGREFTCACPGLLPPLLGPGSTP